MGLDGAPHTRAPLRAGRRTDGHARGDTAGHLLARLLQSLLLAILIVGVGTLAMFATTAPELISVLLEPFMLLLTPGLVPVLLMSGPHDFVPDAALAFNVFFYTVLLFTLGTRQQQRRRTARSRAAGGSR